MGPKINGTLPGTGNNLSGHKVRWTNGTKWEAGEPRNEKAVVLGNKKTIEECRENQKETTYYMFQVQKERALFK